MVPHVTKFKQLIIHSICISVSVQNLTSLLLFILCRIQLLTWWTCGRWATFILRYTLFLHLQGQDQVYSSINTACVPTAPHCPTCWKRSSVHNVIIVFGHWTQRNVWSNEISHWVNTIIPNNDPLCDCNELLLHGHYAVLLCNTSVIHLSYDKSVWTERGWQGMCNFNMDN